MLQLAITCLVIALIAAVLGFGGIAGSFLCLPGSCGTVVPGRWVPPRTLLGGSGTLDFQILVGGFERESAPTAG